jgi:hypothetical protein
MGHARSVREQEKSVSNSTNATVQRLRDFIENGCDARPEDKHHALQDLEAIQSETGRIADLERELGLERESHETTKRMLADRDDALSARSATRCTACGAKEGEPCRGNCERAMPSSTGDTTPQESPLAWVVFTPNDPQGFDYRVFPEEREARSWASNDADSTFEPLYRASAFTRSANVPREPTEEMQKAMVAALFDLDHSDLKLKDAYKMVRKAYRAAMAVVDRRMNDG